MNISATQVMEALRELKEYIASSYTTLAGVT